MMFTKILIIVSVFVASASASPKARSNQNEKGFKFCETYTDVNLCEAAKARCLSGYRRIHNGIGWREEKEKYFETCIQQSDLASLFETFKASLDGDEVMSHGGRKNFYLDVDKDTDMDGDQEDDDQNTDDQEDDDVKMTSSEDRTKMEMGSMSFRHEGLMKPEMMKPGMMKKYGTMKKYGMMKHDMMKYGKKRHGNKGSLVKKFLESLPSDKYQSFRCCIANFRAKLENGVLNREATKAKISERVIADTVALIGFSKGIDTCTLPEACEMRDFNICALKSCTDEVISQL